MRIDRIARNLLANEAEHAIDAALAGPFPEAVARSLVERRVLERVLAEVLATTDAEDPDADPAERFVDRLASDEQLKRLGDVLAERIIHSEEFERILADVVASPAIRHALTRQATGFGAETAAAIRRGGSRTDDALESGAHRLVGRARTTDAQRRFGGIATRAVALAIDVGLAQLWFLVAAATVTLIASLAGVGHPGPAAAGAAGIGWLLVSAIYFVGFWSYGQTPGMWVLRLRVATRDGQPPGVLRSLVRFVGLDLSIALAFLGFLPVLFDSRRRGLADYLAGTTVLREADE